MSGRYSNNARFGINYFEAAKHPSLIDSSFPPMTFFRARPGLPDHASPDQHAVADVLRHNISRPNSNVIVWRRDGSGKIYEGALRHPEDVHAWIRQCSLDTKQDTITINLAEKWENRNAAMFAM